MDPEQLRQLAIALGLPADSPEPAVREAIDSRRDPLPGALRVAFTPDSVDRDNRTVRAVIATDNPVRVFDYREWEFVDEILVMGGCDLSHARQIGLPVLDSHHRDRCGDVLGSWSELTISAGELRGVATFGRTQSAEDALILAEDGHLRGVSVGYNVLRADYLDPGQSVIVDGVEYTNPDDAKTRLKVSSSWTPTEGSFTPIGADSGAGTRSASITPAGDPLPAPQTPTRTSTMDPIELALRARGFSAEDASRHAANLKDVPEDQIIDIISRMSPSDPAGTRAALATVGDDTLSAEERATAIEQGRQAERARTAAITSAFTPFLARQGSVTDDAGQERSVTGQQLLEEQLRSTTATADSANATLVRFLASEPSQTPLAGRTSIGVENRDHARANISASLQLRASAVVGSSILTLDDETRKRGEEYGLRSQVDLARQCLIASGVAPQEAYRMSPNQVVGMALSSRYPDGRALPGMSTSDFSSILMDTANKTLMAAFQQAAATWRQWCYVDQVSDFRAKNLVSLSGLSVFDVVPEGGDFPLVTMSDQGETVQAKTRGAIVRFTRQAIINDDTGAFARTPLLLANAADLTISKAAVTLLLANGNMAYDATALFAVGHNNLLTGASYDPTTTEKAKACLNALKTKLRKQTGIEGNPIAIQPQVVLGGPTGEDFLREAISDTSTTDKDRTPNRGIRGLDIAIEPLLEDTGITGNSATAVHLFANPTLAPVIVLAFLQGQIGPYLERQTDFLSDGFDTKARNDFGVGKADHRGAAKSTGA